MARAIPRLNCATACGAGCVASGRDALAGECRALDESLGQLYDLYDERIEYYQENPPGPDWDGVFVATTK